MKKLSTEAHAYLNDAFGIAERDMWFDRMTALFDGKEDEYNSRKVFTLHGIVPRPKDNWYMYKEPENWVIDCLELMLTTKGSQPDGFTPVCVEYPPYGVHYIDKMLGANVYHITMQDSGMRIILPHPSARLKCPTLIRTKRGRCPYVPQERSLMRT